MIFFVRKKKLDKKHSILIIEGVIYMNQISTEKINEIRKSVNIVDVISNYISLTPKGKNYFGVCPFHDDNHPSMSVSKEKQIYTCFSCGATGNVFKFIMDYENIPFMEALGKVAAMGHVDVDIAQHIRKKERPHNNLYDIYALSLKLYMNNINTPKGKEAKQYLYKRGIDENIIKEFQIGLALDNKTLSKILINKFNEKDVLESGLSRKSTYEYLDLFYNRIMFPLYDLEGNVVGYSGRVYNTSDDAKYINTKETSIFKKGELLYNYHKAKNPARAKNRVIIMEGFMDVIRAHTIGVTNVIASMGTAVTKKQAMLIKRMAKDVILCFDGDAAGAKATLSCGDTLLEIGVTPKVVRLPNNLDPDEFILKYGKEEFESKINNSVNLMDFKLSYLKQDKNLSSAAGEANYINSVIVELEKIDDDILREVTIKKLVEETGIDENLIKSKLSDTIKVVRPTPKVQSKEKTKINKYEIAQRNLVGYMLKNSKVIQKIDDELPYIPIKEYRILAREITFFYEQYGYINVAEFFNYIEYDKDIMETISKIERANLKDKISKDEIDDYINAITDYNIKTETKILTDKMKSETDPLKKAIIAQKMVELKKGV